MITLRIILRSLISMVVVAACCDDRAIAEISTPNAPVAVDASHSLSSTESFPLGPPPLLNQSRPSEAEGSDASLERPAHSSGSGVGEITKVGGALAAVIFLMLVVRVLMGRGGRSFTGPARPSGVVQVLARYPLARGQTLVLIQLARRILLVAHGSGTATTLAEVTSAEEVADLLARMEAGASGLGALKFTSLLKRFTSEHHSPPSRTFPPESEVSQVIDLTRSQGRGVAGVFGKRTRL